MGQFCSACGERFLSEADFNFKHFLFHQVPHELGHWDGKLGRTLRELVFAPGKMAAEYVRGRRQPYLNPLRLYLVVFVAHAFVSAIGTPALGLAERVKRYDSTGLVARLTDNYARLESIGPIRAQHAETYNHWLSEGGTLLIVFLVALALLAVMIKYRRRYLEHLTLSLNVVTFTLLVMIVADIFTLILGRGSISDVADSYRINAAACLLPIYWFFGIRRFYGTTWSGAILYSVAITVANVLIANLLNIPFLLLMIAVA